MTSENTHADIRIRFELGGRALEAINWPVTDSVSPLTPNAQFHLCVTEDSKVVGEEDWPDLWEHRGELPLELRPYKLVTKRPARDFHNGVYHLKWVDYRWCEGRGGFDSHGEDSLLLRLCDSSRGDAL